MVVTWLAPEDAHQVVPAWPDDWPDGLFIRHFDAVQQMRPQAGFGRSNQGIRQRR
jgi:hypothetical protein